MAKTQDSSSQELELLQGAVRSVVHTASMRHRHSLDKAVEVLECVADAANEPLDHWSAEKVDATMELIQQAMHEAIRRHRRTIADAVRFAEETDDVDIPATTPVTVVEHGTDDSIHARIQRAVSTAYLRGTSSHVNGVEERWAPANDVESTDCI